MRTVYEMARELHLDVSEKPAHHVMWMMDQMRLDSMKRAHKAKEMADAKRSASMRRRI